MRRPCLLLLLGATACGGDTTPAGDGPDAAPGLPDPAHDSRVEIIERADNRGGGAGTSIYAVFYEDAIPTTERELMSAGDCRLLEHANPFCAEPCDGVCVATDTCAALPLRVGAGTLSVISGDVDLDLTPTAEVTYREWLDGVELRDDDVAIALEGGPGPALSATAPMPPALVMPELDADYAIPDAGDWTVEWTPGGDPAARVRLELEKDLHGGGPMARIACDVPDTGSLVVDAALLDHARFRVNPGCGECPRQWLRRYRVVDAGVDGVDVILGSQLNLEWYARPE